MARTKSETVIVRVTPKHKQQLDRAAKRSGLATSDYVRLVLALAVQSKTVGEFVDRCAEE